MKIQFLLLIAIFVIPLLFAEGSFAQDLSKNDQISIPKLSMDKTDDSIILRYVRANSSLADQTRFIYSRSEITESKTYTIKKEDILRAVPSISTKDNQTIGLLIPPLAYFAKKF